MRLSDSLIKKVEGDVAFSLAARSILDLILIPDWEGGREQLLPRLYVPNLPTTSQGRTRLKFIRRQFLRSCRDQLLRPPLRGAVGETELALAGFFHDPSALRNYPNLLTISGAIGSGKTSLLKFVFLHLLPRMLKPEFVKPPLVVDCYPLGGAAIQDSDRYEPSRWIGIEIEKSLKNIELNPNYPAQVHEKLDVARDLLLEACRSGSVTAVGQALDSAKREHGLEFILAVDNVDALPTSLTSEYRQHARLLACDFGLRVAMAWRPPTSARDAKYGDMRGAVLEATLHVSPPQLVDILQRRIEFVRSDPKMAEELRLIEEDQHTSEWIRFMLGALASRATSRVYQMFANGNVRDALLYAMASSRYPRLNREFFTLEHRRRPRRTRRWRQLPRYLVLQSLLLQTFNCYSEKKHFSREIRQKILNILRLSTTGADVLRSNLYVLTSLVAHVGKPMPIAELRAVSHSLGFSPEATEDDLEALLDFGLISSPDHRLGGDPEDPTSAVEWGEVERVEITPCGRWYLDTVAQDSEYQSWVGLDQDLPDRFYESTAAQFKSRGIDCPFDQPSVFAQDPMLYRVAASLVQFKAARHADLLLLTDLADLDDGVRVHQALRSRWPHRVLGLGLIDLCEHKQQMEIAPELDEFLADLQIDVKKELDTVRPFLKKAAHKLRVRSLPKTEAPTKFLRVADKRSRTMLTLRYPPRIPVGEIGRGSIQLKTGRLRLAPDHSNLIALIDAFPQTRIGLGSDSTTLEFDHVRRQFCGEFKLEQFEEGLTHLSVRVLADGRTAGRLAFDVRGLPSSP